MLVGRTSLHHCNPADSFPATPDNQTTIRPVAPVGPDLMGHHAPIFLFRIFLAYIFLVNTIRSVLKFLI